MDERIIAALALALLLVVLGGCLVARKIDEYRRLKVRMAGRGKRSRAVPLEPAE